MPPRATLVALALLVCACGGGHAVPDAPAPAGAPALPARLEDGRTLVTYLGTIHERHYVADYSLATVEAVVRAFAPDVVLVELPPDDVARVCAEVDALGDDAGPATLSNRWVRTLPEVYRVVVPLRHELGYEVAGISGWSAGAWDDRAAYFEDHPHGPEHREYIVSNAAYHAVFIGRDGWNDPVWLHGDEHLEAMMEAALWLAYHAEGEMGRGGPLTLHARHADLLAAALETWRGQRILVVFDVTARWSLEPLIDLRSHVYRAPIETWLP